MDILVPAVEAKATFGFRNSRISRLRAGTP